MTRLLYVGQQVADELKDRIDENVERYRAGDFIDLEVRGDWRIPLSLDVDLDELKNLKADGGAESEIQNSLIVGRVLAQLTASLARENRLWVRLSHVECLDYSRKRWLRSDASEDDLGNDVANHFFASTLTGCRDDHAIARLWWNYHIAKQVMPDDPERALKSMLARADIRLNFLERPGIAARRVLAAGIVKALERSSELLFGEDLFRKFMKEVNLRGAGIVFEVWDDARVDQFMANCLGRAKADVD